MKLKELIKEIGGGNIIGNADVEISGIATRAETVCNGDLFVCYKGINRDSHEFAAKAVEKGAAAIVSERNIACN